MVTTCSHHLTISIEPDSDSYIEVKAMYGAHRGGSGTVDDNDDEGEMMATRGDRTQTHLRNSPDSSRKGPSVTDKGGIIYRKAATRSQPSYQRRRRTITISVQGDCSPATIPRPIAASASHSPQATEAYLLQA